MLDFGLYTLYVLMSIAVAAAIIFPLIHSVSQPGALVKLGIGIAVIVVLFGLSYALSGSEVSARIAAAGVTEAGSKLIGAGLIMFYITLVLAVLALIYSEMSKAFR